MFLLLSACVATSPSLEETALVADTALDTAAPPEQVTGGGYLSGPAPGLCAVALTCDQEIPDEPKLDCALTVVNDVGHVEYDGLAGVELRGRSSMQAPKHQYGIELRDADGAAHAASLLGMSADPDWVLHGNYYDRSLFRNKLAFDLFGSLPGRWAPRTRYCELTLDGEWLGIYTLDERVKRAPGRIDIAADDGTGASFVLKVDEDGYLYENTAGHGGWRLEYPGDADVTAQAGIIAALDDWYVAQASAAPSSAFADVDRGSLIDLLLIEELAKNNDAFYLSLFSWRDGGGLIAFTPWDMDLTFGQPSYNDNENPERWIAYRPDFPARLADDPAFRADMAARWAALRADAWSDARITALIDRYQQTMAPALDRNFEVWPIDEIQFLDDYLYPVGSYAEEEATVRAWVTARLAWMDENVGAY